MFVFSVTSNTSRRRQLETIVNLHGSLRHAHRRLFCQDNACRLMRAFGVCTSAQMNREALNRSMHISELLPRG
jgi:hypothetical protein